MGQSRAGPLPARSDLRRQDHRGALHFEPEQPAGGRARVRRPDAPHAPGGSLHRVIMVQVENEVGVLGDARDRSAAANEAFAKPVPRELLDYLAHPRQPLLPEFKKVWDAGGSKTSETWEEVFGEGAKADEIFMAWNYTRYLDAVTQAGKKEYAIPMFVNAWIVQPEDKGPGDYPSGGPQNHMHDIWRAGAPHIDLLCPDIYLPDFTGIVASYARSGNTIFVPESASDTRGAANAFYAIGQHSAIGYSPFGIDNISQLMRAGPDAPPPARPPPPRPPPASWGLPPPPPRPPVRRPTSKPCLSRSPTRRWRNSRPPYWSTSPRGPSPPLRSTGSIPTSTSNSAAT